MCQGLLSVLSQHTVTSSVVSSALQMGKLRLRKTVSGWVWIRAACPQECHPVAHFYVCLSAMGSSKGMEPREVAGVSLISAALL